MNSQLHALTVLTRLAGRRPQEASKLLRALEGRLNVLAPLAMEVASETGDPIGRMLSVAIKRSGDTALAARLVKLLPKNTTALKEAAVVITDLAIAEAGEEEVLSLKLDLATRLGDTGERVRALAVAEGVLASALDPATPRDIVMLSRAYVAVASALRDVGRYDEALAPSLSAIDLRRNSASSAVGGELAHALGVSASILSALGRREEAAVAARDAAERYEDLAGTDPVAYRPLLADMLSNLATFEIELGRFDVGIDTQRRALEVYRVLAERNPDAYLSNVAIGCNNLANNLSLARRFDEALPLAEEAMTILSNLATARPDVFGDNLAIAQNTLSNRLNDLGRTQEAIDVSRKSVAAMRSLAMRYPTAFAAHSARSLHTLAYRLFEGGGLDEAALAISEAIEIRTSLTASNERASGLPLAMSLAVQAAIQRKSGRTNEAAESIDRSFRLLARMAAHFGNAIAREAKEIGGRYLRFLEEAGQAVDESLVATIKDRCGVNEFAEIS